MTNEACIYEQDWTCDLFSGLDDTPDPFDYPKTGPIGQHRKPAKFRKPNNK